ncbi:hypothetical protein Nepgr_004653 [Nepenthes gracilis]|uniref:Uncharacterized protein n=1 Tax=Nepenthes gracilis TaxID=150966 RepID=A0AAD3S221_NEPGR|nr:hypothetical protein Nepgr_004653 [Nepenthes gracilis]
MIGPCSPTFERNTGSCGITSLWKLTPWMALQKIQAKKGAKVDAYMGVINCNQHRVVGALELGCDGLALAGINPEGESLEGKRLKMGAPNQVGKMKARTRIENGMVHDQNSANTDANKPGHQKLVVRQNGWHLRVRSQYVDPYGSQNQNFGDSVKFVEFRS